ncbi:MAG: hypothetical protein WBL74_10890 [Novosphingobium sp.]|uniref:hypothetical protein n=1 Tax=Novosphingobium sp. TaxID=1874826 RepID=UPI003C7C904B
MNLLYKHQVALIRAGEAARETGKAYCGEAKQLAGQIQRRRESLGVPQYRMGCSA